MFKNTVLPAYLPLPEEEKKKKKKNRNFRGKAFQIMTKKLCKKKKEKEE